MKVSEVREKYLKFFENKGHVRIAPAPLIPEINTGTLFTPFGMQQLVPYLMGEKHPAGTRLVNSQPSIRLDDIDEVGDNRHTTFFEMLGNWSLGDYFKEEQLSWLLEFLTKDLGLAKEKLWVSVFEGNRQVPKDLESVKIWKKLGIPEKRIGYYDAKKNWWSMSGVPKEMPVGDIGGPDSEIFYDFGDDKKFHENSIYAKEECHMNCDCGRFLEIGNSVFMQYKKIGKDKLEELPNKNVDFGGGLERLAAATIDSADVFKIDIFQKIINKIEDEVKNESGVKYEQDNYKKSFRIVADHIRASVVLISEGVFPSNKTQGYVLRRLIRRSVYHGYLLSGHLDGAILPLIADKVERPNSRVKREEINKIIWDESVRFGRALDRGLRKLNKVIEKKHNIDGKLAFDLYQTDGFPLELTLEILEQKGIDFDKKNQESFKNEFEKHKHKSRTTSAGVFKGGLADHSPEVIKFHTATHLLLASLRKVLGDSVVQKGQNINAKRSRFDFNHTAKLTPEELKSVEDLINKKIKENHPVTKKKMKKSEAEKTGAIHAFGEKYGDEVNVYFVGKDLESAFSKEFCGGPHVAHTAEIGRVRIKKQDKIGSGVIRIYLETEGAAN